MKRGGEEEGRLSKPLPRWGAGKCRLGLLPVKMEISPDDPVVDNPVESTRSPELEDVDAPVAMVTEPEAPEALSPVATLSIPDEAVP